MEKSDDPFWKENIVNPSMQDNYYNTQKKDLM